MTKKIIFKKIIIKTIKKISIKKTHAQAAFEFMLLISLLLTMYLMFNTFISKETKDIKYEKEQVMLKDLSYSIQLEMNFAQNVNNGYSRTLIIPNTLDGINYTLKLIGSELSLNTSHQEYNIELPYFNGTITKGNNTIKKRNDTVFVEQP